MSVVSMAPGLIAAAGTAAFAARMAYWSRCKPVRSQESVADWIAAAPVELKTSILVFCDRWQELMMWQELGFGSPETGFPTVLDVQYTPYGLDVQVQMRGGHKTSDWTDQPTLDAFAQYIGVPEVTAMSEDPGFVRLQVRVLDTLATASPVPVLIPEDIDLEAVPAGVFENGELWTVPVQGRHILAAGGMGSGKSSLLWSLVNGMGPAIRSGRVELRVIDPKGGMELGYLEPLCTRFSCTTADEMVGQLEETVVDLQAAAQRYRGKVRKPVPTPDNPLVVTIIDEAATLSSFSDPKLQARFERAHGLLLSQGRAPLYSVIETVIDPSKENVPQRQLLPYRVGMRMDEPGQVEMIHGRGARNRGSYCDRIPHSTPGVCFVQEDGKAGFRRARAFQVTDDDVDRITRAYKPEPRPINLADFPGGRAA
ncbi:DNA segregation ATPase FtsK/SpoIIIE-related protein [Nocardia nova SH22a]|uniref:DNA segregation ATPase FtsK/SpoIIIE-related protein n=1 Tax=Nocardia nova SH22a TaxID=1415166 RepID=W5TE34_9NOCA|nr:FtsK/SpoIIIE domain-containing protein [Nocardia nova]AHH17263.1 DNA segregation ATPase FtsK/SpoIIIE-related protein [Nocardia nova SH22a]